MIVMVSLAALAGQGSIGDIADELGNIVIDLLLHSMLCPFKTVI